MHTLYRNTGWIRAAAAASLVALLGAWLSAQANNDDDHDESFKKLRVIGLTDDGRLVWFKAGSPSKTDDIGYVAGLSGTDTALVGIDYRVQDGQLYGVGTGGGVYRLDTSTAVATLVNSLTV